MQRELSTLARGTALQVSLRPRNSEDKACRPQALDAFFGISLNPTLPDVTLSAPKASVHVLPGNRCETKRKDSSGRQAKSSQRGPRSRGT